MNAITVDVLIVEDNPADLELAQRAFARLGFANTIEVARDGQEALDYLLGTNGHAAGLPPKLILLDFKLPKVDGLHVLREVRAAPALRHLPVVVLTSSREN